MPDTDKSTTQRKKSWRMMFWVRRAHGWISVASLLGLLLFAVSGIALHHEIGIDPETNSHEATAPSNLLDPIDDLRIVEWLRNEHQATGPLVLFEVQERDILIQFERPGSSLAAEIDREDGTTYIDTERGGVFAMMSDIHTGRSDSLSATLIIDGVAIALIIAAISGLMLWIKQANRRREMLLSLGIGTVAYGLLIFWLF